VARIRIQRPRSASEAVGSLPGVALITFVELKLAGVVTWSWWWVLSPLWLGVAPLALLAGSLVILWSLGQWPFLLVDRWRVRRQARSFFRFQPVPVPSACQNGAETGDIDQHQDDSETGPDQHRSSLVSTWNRHCKEKVYGWIP
jgi:hypothetical protein